MNKNIITEITRINQLMNTSLITEVIGGIWKSLADNIINLLSKSNGKLSSKVNNFLILLRNAKNDDEIITILAELARISDDFSKIITPKVMSTLSIKNKQSIEELKEYLEKNIKEKTITRDMANQMTNKWVNDRVETEFEGVRDVIRKEVDNYIEDVIRKNSKPIKPKPIKPKPIKPKPIKPKPIKPKPVEPKPVEPIIDTHRPEIFDITTWDSKEFVSIDKNIIAELLKNKPFWDSIVDKFENLFKPTDEKIVNIQKLGKAIDITTDVKLKTKLQNKLKSELEWLFKKNTNNFVYMRNYFDEITKIDKNFKKYWDDIKESSKNGWDFYKTFGSVANEIEGFSWFWRGIKDNLKLMFNTEKKLWNKITKQTPKNIDKSNIVKDFWAGTFVSGSNRGFPTMSNESYRKLIQTYGLKGAKAAYWRDIVINMLKWNIYVNLLRTIRNLVATALYEDDLQACINSKEGMNSKECKEIESDGVKKAMMEWVIQYKNNPNGGTDFITNWIFDSLNFEHTFLNIDPSDMWYKKVFEILGVIDPGLVTELISAILSIPNVIDNTEKKDKLLKTIDEMILKAKNETKTAEDTVQSTVLNFRDDKTNTSDVGLK